VFHSTIKYGRYFYLLSKFYEPNTLSEQKVSKSLYFIMSSTSFVKYRGFYENMVWINSVVNVKQKRTI